VCAFFKNLRLRAESDDCLGLISGEATTIPASESVPPASESVPPASEPRWQDFPSAKTDSTETRKNKALACRNQLVNAIAVAKCRKDLGELRRKWTKPEVNWVTKFLLSDTQTRKLKAILATDQQELDL
jgi:hypothetical protein